ncbi:DUF192 domain-containing protein [Candidatus Pacearchaeota archaeon]|nr:DUF192 domain-containing protein [Candidatus Pacearchaeota archaeon]
MKINFNNKILEISDVKRCNCFEKIIGLMFCRREKANALVFSFKKKTKMAIHSFFVFFPFFAVWLDNENKVIGMKKVKPFFPRISSPSAYFNLLEIPINKKYEKILNSFVTDGFPKRFK